MRRFWKFGAGGELESRLEGRRQPARPEFVHQLARELRPTGRRRFVSSRLVLAAALTLIMLVAVASVGGVAAGAGIRDQLVAAAKSVNNQVTAQRGSSFQLADADDDDNGGGGGGGDDDDDGGGGDDDDDGDDDQYEEERRECRRALNQAERDFSRQQKLEHKAFHAANQSASSHRAFHRGQRAAEQAFDELQDEARESCRQIGR